MTKKSVAVFCMGVGGPVADDAAKCSTGGINRYGWTC